MLGITHATTSGRRGFTLIEMSIVLVIIGLIIGGILKGQEIIESSRQKNVITQLDSVKSAINTFADKYNALPGDYGSGAERILTGLTDGDDSGIIGVEANSAANMAAYDANATENLHFWNHLAAAELVSGTTIGTSDQFGDGGVMPATAIPGAGMTALYGRSENGENDRQTHWVRIHKNTDGGTDGTTDGAMSGKRAFEVDLKLDDGRPVDGTMRITAADTTNCGSTTTYIATSNVQSCVPYFELVQ